MQQYHWRDCPADVQSQVENFVGELRALRGTNLIGIYLHGSFAMGCFNPRQSDLDLLVLIDQNMAAASRKAMAALVLASSNHPRPVEISVLTQSHLHPWRYPTPFAFHYSESHRAQFEQGDWKFPVSVDPDLAAHITIIH